VYCKLNILPITKLQSMIMLLNWSFALIFVINHKYFRCVMSLESFSSHSLKFVWQKNRFSPWLCSKQDDTKIHIFRKELCSLTFLLLSFITSSLSSHSYLFRLWVYFDLEIETRETQFWNNLHWCNIMHLANMLVRVWKM